MVGFFGGPRKNPSGFARIDNFIYIVKIKVFSFHVQQSFALSLHNHQNFLNILGSKQV